MSAKQSISRSGGLKEDTLSKEELLKYLELLQEASIKNDVIELKQILEEAVEGFTPEKEIVDAIFLQQKNKELNRLYTLIESREDLAFLNKELLKNLI